MSEWKPQYRRWKGESVGPWKRRLAISRYGLRLCLSGKIIKAFLFIGIGQALFLSLIYVVLGQLLTPESSLVNWIEKTGGERIVTIINGITSWALLYPEICVDGVYRVSYFLMRFPASLLSIVIVALFIHKLIAHDMASQAIVIYNSKALTRWDYLAGKFTIVASILSLVWIFPILSSWLVGNLLAPDWAFFVHTFPSLIRGLTVGIVATLSLSSIALAVSSLAKKTGTAIAFWILGWISLNLISDLSRISYSWFEYVNPLKSINELSEGVFKMDSFITEAQNNLPFIDRVVAKATSLESLDQIPASDGALMAPLIALTAMSALSLFIVHRRIAVS